MSNEDHPMTLQQERIAYRRAVQQTLIVIFEKNPSEAEALVGAWWKKIVAGEAFRTGLFMHYEPLNTAASLAKLQKAPAIRDVQDQYLKIITESMPKRRTQRKKQSGVEPRTAHAA